MKTSEKVQSIVNCSARAECIAEYYFSEKLREIDQMRKAGRNVINLGIGSPDLSPLQSAIRVLEESAHLPSAHGYQGYSGIPELRSAFADWYAKYFDITLDPEDEILPLMGSKEGIMHITMAFVNPGQEVLVPDPGYPAYASAARLSGALPVTYDLKEESHWLPDIASLECRDLSKVKLMWVNYPNMPTGQKANKRLFKELVAFGKRNGILICNDNPYSFILNEEHISILSVEGAMGIALELNSVSKSHNMPGWRVGMVAGHRNYIKSIIRIKSNMDSGMFRPLQLAAAEALSAGDEWYGEINRQYGKRRVYAERIMEQIGCSFDKGQGGMFLWGKVPQWYKDAGELCDSLLYNAEVFVTPGFVFGSNGGRYVRISLCASEELLMETSNRIGAMQSIVAIDNIKGEFSYAE
ncbi:MAG: pyridoxal phosphate-dependent aminotransferase [Bacteroidales bacterium]